MNIILGGLGLIAIHASNFFEPKDHVYDPVTKSFITINPMTTEPNIERYARYLHRFNLGCMRSLQANPNDMGTDCMLETVKTNDIIAKMFNASNYSTG